MNVAKPSKMKQFLFCVIFIVIFLICSVYLSDILYLGYYTINRDPEITHNNQVYIQLYRLIQKTQTQACQTILEGLRGQSKGEVVNFLFLRFFAAFKIHSLLYLNCWPSKTATFIFYRVMKKTVSKWENDPKF